jgi:hypothetical protein
VVAQELINDAYGVVGVHTFTFIVCASCTQA